MVFDFIKRLFSAKRSAIRENLLFVLLLRSPFNVHADAIEAAARKAWPQLQDNDGDGSNFVTSDSLEGGCVLSPNGNALLVFSTLRGVRQLAAPKNLNASSSEAWATYTADVSVQVMYRFEQNERKLLGYLANLTAELIDENCLALMHPASGRLFEAQSNLPARLREKPSAFVG